MDGSIAEEILVLTADERGRLHRTDGAEALVGGAVLADLALQGVLELETAKDGHGVVRLTSNSDAAHLGSAAESLSHGSTLTPELVTRIGRTAYDEEVERLVAAGTLAREDSRVLGLVPRTRIRLVAPDAAESARVALREAASASDSVDGRVATIVALLDGAGELDRVIGGRAAKTARARSLSEDAPAAQVADLLRGISVVAGAASAAATPAAAAATSAAVS